MDLSKYLTSAEFAERMGCGTKRVWLFHFEFLGVRSHKYQGQYYWPIDKVEEAFGTSRYVTTSSFAKMADVSVTTVLRRLRVEGGFLGVVPLSGTEGYFWPVDAIRLALNEQS